MMLICDGLVHDAVHEKPYVANILTDHGKIIEIAPGLARPDAERVDASGLNVYPGFVDAHSHTGLAGYGIGYEGTDYNEINDPVCPHLRAIDAIQPFDPTLREAREAGVTCVCTGPGSANALGGTFAAIKTAGRRVEDMCVLAQAAMKCAFGENIKNVYRDKGNFSRMSTAAKLREALFKAREYQRKIRLAGEDESKLPTFDMKSQALLPVLEGTIPLKAHAHQADDMFTALRIAREFNVRITLEHCTEGHLIADLLAKENVPVAVGPSFGTPHKFECRNQTWTTPGILDRAGLSVSIITDAPFIPQKHLTLCAAMASQAGMDPFHALQAITRNAARHIGVEDRLGTLEAGKDADIALMEGDVFSLSARVRKVFIDGVSVF